MVASQPYHLSILFLISVISHRQILTCLRIFRTFPSLYFSVKFSFNLSLLFIKIKMCETVYSLCFQTGRICDGSPEWFWFLLQLSHLFPWFSLLFSPSHCFQTCIYESLPLLVSSLCIPPLLNATCKERGRFWEIVLFLLLTSQSKQVHIRQLTPATPSVNSLVLTLPSSS